MLLEPLASAAVVFRHRRSVSVTVTATATATATAAPNDSSRSATGDWELQHVVDLVSAFLDAGAFGDRRVLHDCERGVGLRLLRRAAAVESAALVHANASSPPSSTPSDKSAPSVSTSLANDPFYRASLAARALVAAVRRDDLEVAQWLCTAYCPRVVVALAVVEAAAAGSLCVLQWFFDAFRTDAMAECVVLKAAETGQLAVLQWAVPLLGEPANVALLLRSAAEFGSLEMVRWLLEQHAQSGGDEVLAGTFMGGSALVNAIMEGHLEVTKFLYENGFYLSPWRSSQAAVGAKHGDLELLEWLHAHEFTVGTTGWLDAAAAAGHLRVLEWVHENLPDDVCDPNTMNIAAANGHLEVVQWLHANRPEAVCSCWAMDQAAANGHLAVLKWLHANRTEGCSPSAMNGAAANGHLDVVQWLNANCSAGCSTVAMDNAASGGHLDIVRWLHAHRSEGCTTWAMDWAATNDHIEVVEWLQANRTEGCTVVAMDQAQSVEMLQWLLEHRTERCSPFAMENAARRGNFAKLLWLRERGLDVCTECVAAVALDASHFEVFQWVRAHYPAIGDMVRGHFGRFPNAWAIFLALDARESSAS